eukprot:TRINITY_DN4873_c0_g1_i1.p1 TRINITY_DN4873_c0_g1~~TRINITY_DN4873_c0_g1_i1.p1  ORF type:complete len:457 (-),score=67.35 TRINITY_DN4873_c0_g1_i1:355-1629(-)
MEFDVGANEATSSSASAEKPLLSEPGETSAEKGKDNSSFFTLFLILKSYVGSGILGLPYAFLQGGLYPGIVALLIIAIISYYCIFLLLEIKHRLVASVSLKRPTFDAIGKAIYGRPGQITVLFSLIITQTGFGTAYVIFITRSLFALFPEIAEPYFALMLFPFLAGVCQIRQIKYLSIPSAAAYIAIIAGLCAVLYHCFQVGFTAGNPKSLHVTTLPVFFGIAVYIFEGIGVVIDIEGTMKKPQQFIKVQTLAYGLMIVTFAIVGTLGYLSYGDKTNAIVLMNLPHDWKLYPISLFVVMFGLFFTYPVQMFPIFKLAERALVRRDARFVAAKRFAVRFWIVAATVLVSILIPHFSLFLSLIGGFGCAFLAFVLPTAFHLKLFWKESTITRKISHILILFFGVSASLITTAVTIYEIVVLSKNKS